MSTRTYRAACCRQGLGPTHAQCQKPVRRLTSASSLFSRERGASLCCPALPDCRAAAPAVEEVATRTSVHDGDPMKEESFSALFYFLYLFPQLSPGEDRVGLGLHIDLDSEWEIQQVIHQPGGSVSQVCSSGANL